MSLNGAAGTDFDLYLYDGNAVSIADESVAKSESGSYPDSISYQAAETGWHYMRAYGYSGTGSYSLGYSISGGSLDDDIPGVAIPPSSFAGQLDQTYGSDVDDVYGLNLTAGQFLTVAMTGAPDTDFDIFLFDPGAESVSLSSAVAGSSTGSNSDEFGYLVPATGKYFLDVFASSGDGSYSVRYSVGAPPPTSADDDIPGLPLGPSPRSNTLSAATDKADAWSVPIAAGQTLRASIVGASGTDFDLYVFPPGTPSMFDNPYVESAVGWAYPDQLTYTAPAGGTYYLVAHSYSGSGSYQIDYEVLNPAPAPLTLATSTRISAPSRAKVKKKLKIAGTVAPGGPGVVTITMTRKVGRRWKSAGHAHVGVVGGSYSYSFKPRYRGSWRFVSSYSGGAIGSTTYLGSKSATKSVKVK
jgi:hypothetical protein